MSAYRFARSRRWVAAHLMVLMFMGLFLIAGNWQIHRMRERQSFNRTLAAREAEAPADLAPLLANEKTASYRRTHVSGTYDGTREVLLEGRSVNGRAGRDVLTPLVVRPGVAVIVDRGWIPISDVPIGEAKPPSGAVVVTGLLLPSERGFGNAVPAPGPSPGVSHVDLTKLGSHMPYTLLPLYVHLQTQSPPQPGEFPSPRTITKLDAGQNLNYAVQWFIFATITAIGYSFVLRRAARRAYQASNP